MGAAAYRRIVEALEKPKLTIVLDNLNDGRIVTFINIAMMNNKSGWWQWIDGNIADTTLKSLFNKPTKRQEQ